MSVEQQTHSLQYATAIRAPRRKYRLGLLACVAASLSYGIHALQFWPADPIPVWLFFLGATLAVVGLLLAAIGLIDRRERHPLDFVGLFMNVKSFAVPVWLLH